MQAVLATLPEFNPLRHYPVATPEVRHGDFTFTELLPQCARLLEQQGTGRYGPTLARSPGRNLALPRPGDEVSGGLRHAHLLCAAPYNHLAVQLVPGKQQGHLRFMGDIPGLRAAVVGVKHKTPAGEALEQHNALPGQTLLIHSGQHHGRGVFQASPHRLFQPGLKLPHGAGVKHIPGEPAGRVLAPEILVSQC